MSMCGSESGRAYQRRRLRVRCRRSPARLACRNWAHGEDAAVRPRLLVSMILLLVSMLLLLRSVRWW